MTRSQKKGKGCRHHRRKGRDDKITEEREGMTRSQKKGKG